MAKRTSKYFTTKPTKASTYFKAGVMLFVRGKQVGSIYPDKTTGMFFASTSDRPFDGEFATFSEADDFIFRHYA